MTRHTTAQATKRNVCVCVCIYIYIYTGCPRRNVPDFGRAFFMLKYTDITQNTYVQSWMVTEIMARGKCGLLAGPCTVPVSWESYPCPSLSVVSCDGNSAHASPKLNIYFLQGDGVVSHVTSVLGHSWRAQGQVCRFWSFNLQVNAGITRWNRPRFFPSLSFRSYGCIFLTCVVIRERRSER